MKTNRKQYATPEVEYTTVSPTTMLAASIKVNDGEDNDNVDIEDGSGGWANRKNGAWGDIWGKM